MIKCVRVESLRVELESMQKKKNANFFAASVSLNNLFPSSLQLMETRYCYIESG